jgi:beta-galactosidase
VLSHLPGKYISSLLEQEEDEMSFTEMKDGIFHLDGKKTFFLSADYPYYRDSVDNWADRIEQLKSAHIQVISFYVPWRHHAVNGGIDFDGSTIANRNVKRFIEICAEKEMYVLLKPGPFIHAETDYGGLPDFVNPDNDSEIDPMLSGKGVKRAWQQTLPAPNDSKFNRLIKDWFEQVNEQLIKPNTYPHGPIISLQILNEGVYSDAQHPVTEYDYSSTSIEVFRSFLAEKYNNIKNYNHLHHTSVTSFTEIVPVSELGEITHEADLLRYLDWAEYQSYYMEKLYTDWGGYIETDLPYILNLNPPHDREQGYDDWFNRLEIEKFTNQSYGYTNWIGVVSHDESAFNRYLLLTKRGRGPNLEENWGFSKLYDYRYKYTAIPFFQTVMAVAGGASGYNIYTGVSTDQWDDGIDSMQEKPYPDCSPITETGELTPKYYSLKLLNRFLHEFGSDLMECQAYSPLTWGIYNRYAQIGCWGMEAKIANLGRKPIHLGQGGFDRFQAISRKYNIDYKLLNLASGVPSIADYPIITLTGGFFMEAEVQENLVSYVKEGGKLVLTHDVPVLDENMLPCSVLIDGLFEGKFPADGSYEVGDGVVVYRDNNLFYEHSDPEDVIGIFRKLDPNLTILSSGAQVWVHRHPVKDVAYYFVLGLDEQEKTYTVSDSKYKIEINLPKKSSAIIRVANGKLSAGIVKGIHEFEQSYVAPTIRSGQETVSASEPCDLFFQLSEGKMDYEVATEQDAESKIQYSAV